MQAPFASLKSPPYSHDSALQPTCHNWEAWRSEPQALPPVVALAASRCWASHTRCMLLSAMAPHAVVDLGVRAPSPAVLLQELLSPCYTGHAKNTHNKPYYIMGYNTCDIILCDIILCDYTVRNIILCDVIPRVTSLNKNQGSD